jgi:hypothetical protein
LTPKDKDKITTDEMQCELLILQAQVCKQIGELGNATGCYQDAAAIAQQLGNIVLAGALFQRASEINKIIASQSPAPESFEGGLSQVLNKSIQEISSESFLPDPNQLQAEYAQYDDKLAKIVTDSRFHISDKDI